MRQLVRVLGVAAFAASLACLGYWWIRVAGSGTGSGGWTAAAVDAGLFSLFALHHSVFARRAIRHRVAAMFGDQLVRTVYVWVASGLLAIVCLAWQPVGGTLYTAGLPLRVVLGVVQLTGLPTIVLAVRRISVAELAGLRESRDDEPLEEGGPYRIVRHPVYLGWVLVVFAATPMTMDRLLFAALSTAYLVLAMPLEEAGLVAHFGDEYERYRRRVRWRLIPYLH